METISPYLISKLYTWTIRDLNLIYDRCFDFNHEKGFYDGPSSTYSLALAALIDIWGSIKRDKFGVSNQTKENVKTILNLLYERESQSYEIFDNSKNEILDEIVELFRHNLIHNLGKKPGGKEFDLNIDTTGKAINQQSNGRWHINCRKLKEDFLNLLRVELPIILRN